MEKKQDQALETKLLNMLTSPFWDELQRDHHADGLTIIEYNDRTIPNQYWHCYRSTVQKKDPNHKPVKYSQLNKDIKACFVQSDFINTPEFWESIEHQLQWEGFFMPLEELRWLSRTQIVQELDFLKLLQTEFPYLPYLETVKKVSIQKEHIQEPLPIIAVWQFLRFYADFLGQSYLRQSTIFQSMIGWYVHRFKVENFQTLFPSEQLSILLYLTCELFFWDTISETKRSQLLEIAHPDIQAFFAQHTNNLNILFEGGFNTATDTAAGEIEKTIQQAYYQVCRLDLKYIEIQEFLDNDSGMDFQQQFPRFAYLFEQEKLTFKDRVKALVINFSTKLKGEPISHPQPAYVPARNALTQEQGVNWYDLSEGELTELQTAINTTLKDRIKLFARLRWHKHLQNLGNLFTTPVILWEREKKGCYPIWNILKLSTSLKYQKTLSKKLETEQVERNRLKIVLEQLYKIKNLPEIDRFFSNVPSFSYKLVQQQWTQAMKAHRVNIHNRNTFRLRRMREFGIVTGTEIINDRKDIWLDEMLKIEEEIRPYILFVRQAFQAALPISRSVEFHPYRHSHDGVEFDPMTLQDQDKWLRARVMKTLRNKVTQGEVEQVNAFCLDYSGSMSHEKMRNLFKILFLLIYGLEDRKSYDAVHFFSTEFIETANFSKVYTNRNLLFKVLSKIAIITEDGVKYRGLGGTNISDGVMNCHQRIIEFSKNLRSKNPTVNIACSLFVITDGEPSIGIYEPDELHDFIEEKRKEGNVAIKGIYIKPKDEYDDEGQFLPKIFGKEHYIETTEFKDAVDKFVAIMTKTYQEQRKEFKWNKKRKRIHRVIREKD